MKYLITGAHGFIGSKLTEFLEARGEDVYAMPRQLFTDPKALTQYVHRSSPDFVIHLAAYGNYHDQTDEDQIVASNILGTYVLLKACASSPIKGFINISTSSVYGKKNRPMSETDTLDTRTFYGVSKVCSEYLALAFASKYDVPVVNVRPFTVVGVGEQEQHLIPTLIRSCLEDVPMNFDPSPKHDFIDVQDFIQGLVVIMDNIDTLVGQSINIGSGEDYSNQEVKSMVESACENSALIQTEMKLREYDNSTLVANTKKLDNLGFERKMTLKKTINEMVKAYEKQGA